MPARFNVVAFFKCIDERAVRGALVKRVRLSLSTWMGEPQEVFLQASKNAERHGWIDDSSLNTFSLAGSALLSVYFGSSTTKKYTVLTISSRGEAVVYSLSFPDALNTLGLETAVEVSLIVHRELEAMQIPCVIVAGDELQIEPAVTSDAELLEAASGSDSLVQVVCGKSDKTRLSGFCLFAKRDRAVILVRDWVMKRNVPHRS